MYPTINNPLGEAFFQNLLGNISFNNPTTGRVFFVAKSGITNESEIKATYGAQYYPDGTPMLYTTLALAMASCVASRGDTIILCPGHTETIVGAAGSGVTKAGVTLVGLGTGTLVPTFTFTTAVAASFDITASNVRIQNVNFVCGIDAQTAMVNVTGTDVTFFMCNFTTNTGTVGTILGILTGATSDRLRVDSCNFLGPAVNAGTTTTAQIQYEAAVDIKIVNSYFTGKMTQSILNVTGTVLRGLIDNNRFVVATGTKAIAVAAASTPFITNNVMNVPSGTAPIVAAAGFVGNNTYSAAAGVTAGTAKTI